MKIGLVVNPVAGMGGAVGLKGTDGPGIVAEARSRGAIERAGPRTREALSLLAARAPGAELWVAPGALGTDWTAGLDLSVRRIDMPPLTGTARDTRNAVTAMGNIDLIVFTGGDGTARDVAGTAPDISILGIPAGVKMHSGVFAVTPRAAGALIADVLSTPDRIRWLEAEVMDIDEVALRAGTISPRLYGMAKTPASGGFLQAAKGGPPPDAEGAVKGAAKGIAARMEPGVLYIIGPGRSAGAVMEAAGHTPTLLGVDALFDGKVVARDATARDLHALLDKRPVRIILGVTGHQGFMIGRGNQQIDTTVLRHAGPEGLIVIASPEKLAALAAPRLLVDTGDVDLDAAFCGFHRVATGPGRVTMMRIASE